MVQPNPDVDELRKHARRISRAISPYNLDLADDIEQETLLVALSAKPQNPNAWRSWIRGIAGNIARFSRFRAAQGPLFHGEPEGGIPGMSTEVDPAEVVVGVERDSRVHRMIAELPAEYRRVVELRCIDGLPPRTVAAELSIPVETVRSRYRRGMERLRENAERHFKDDPTVASRPLWSVVVGSLRLPKIAMATVALVSVLLAAVYFVTSSKPAQPVALHAGKAARMSPVSVGHDAFLGSVRQGSTGADLLASVQFQLHQGGGAESVEQVTLHGPQDRRAIARLDPTGTSSLSQLPPGRWTAYVGHRWLGAKELEAGDNVWDAEFASHRQLQIRVIDEAGDSVAGAEVFLFNDETDRVSALGQSSDSGDLNVTVPIGRTWVAARHTLGRVSLSVLVDQPMVVGNDGRISLVLNTVATTEHQLFFDPTIDRSQVQVRSGSLMLLQRYQLAPGFGLVTTAYWLPAWDMGGGGYAIRTAKWNLFEVHAATGGLLWCSSSINPPEGGDGAFHVAARGVVTGQITDPLGRAAVGKEVTLAAGMKGHRMLSPSAMTDHDGRFEFSDVPVDSVRAMLGRIRIATIRVRPHGEILEMTPISHPWVSCRVVLDNVQGPLAVSSFTHLKQFSRSNPETLEQMFDPRRFSLHRSFEGAELDLSAIDPGGHRTFLIEVHDPLTGDDRVLAVGRRRLLAAGEELRLDWKESGAAYAIAQLPVSCLPARAIWVQDSSAVTRVGYVDQETGRITSPPLPKGSWWLLAVDALGNQVRTPSRSVSQEGRVDFGLIHREFGEAQLVLRTVEGHPIRRIEIRDTGDEVIRNVTEGERSLGTDFVRVQLPVGEYVAMTPGNSVQAFAAFRVETGSRAEVVPSTKQVILRCSRSTLTPLSRTRSIALLDRNGRQVLASELSHGKRADDRNRLFVLNEDDAHTLSVIEGGVVVASVLLDYSTKRNIRIYVDRLVREHGFVPTGRK